jgi:GNAT superfamily N-acetyltransferase
MRTVFLGVEEVNAYLRNLIRRLLALGPNMPPVWCPIGPSGSILAGHICRLDTTGRLGNAVQVVRIDYDRKVDQVVFSEGDAAAQAAIENRSALIMDSSVHSGSTLHRALQAVTVLKPRDVCSYSLVLKAGASTIPNYFGVMIADHDRALFLLDEMWNNAVMPFGCLRKLNERDLDRPYVRVDDPEYDKWSWSDHWYDVNADNTANVYVYESRGEIVGMVKFKLKERGELLLDLVAVNKDREGQKLGGHLVRWAETRGRAACCSHVTAWADERQLHKWKKLGYQCVATTTPIKLAGIQFHKIRRKLIYNLPVAE